MKYTKKDIKFIISDFEKAIRLIETSFNDNFICLILGELTASYDYFTSNVPTKKRHSEFTEHESFILYDTTGINNIDAPEYTLDLNFAWWETEEKEQRILFLKKLIKQIKKDYESILD